MQIFDQLVELLDSPLYVIGKAAIGQPAYCDKMQPGKPRKRYVLSLGRQCTCLGFMKFERCRHLAMLHGGFNWVPGDGCPAEYAALESERLIEAVEALPSEARIDRETIPQIVKGITLGLPKLNASEILKIAGTRTFPDGNCLGIIFQFGVTKGLDKLSGIGNNRA
jgi:hypothetical protein